MNRSRAVVVAAAAAAVLAALLAVAVGSGERGLPGAAVSDSVTVTALQECAPPGAGPEQLAVVEECMERLLAAVADRDGIRAAALLADGLGDDPLLVNACHTAGHAVGREHFARMSLEEAAAFGVYSCEGGFLHGLLDEAAVREPTAAAKQAAVAACDARPDDWWCADALGHVMWSSDPDVGRAMRMCGLFSDVNKRRSCGEGVFMRMAVPQEDAGTPAWSTEQVLELCSSKDAVESALRDACPASVASTLAASRTLPSLYESPNPSATVVRSALLKARQDCGSLPGTRQQDGCYIALVWTVAERPGLGPEIAAIGCSIMPESQWRSCADGQADLEGEPRVPLGQIRAAAAASDATSR